MFWNFLALHNRSLRPQPKLDQAGFGLVELIVSISIMVLVMAIILAKQSSFNSAVLLRAQTYEVALSLREVQLSAISANSDGSGDFRSAMGIHFSSSTASNGSFEIFKDPNDNGYSGVSENHGPQGNLDPRFEFRNIRADDAPLSIGEEVSVVFERPNFDAIFYDSTGARIYAAKVEIDVARKGASTNGEAVHDSGVVRTLEITSTGQITVK